MSIEKLLFVVDVIWGESELGVGLFPKFSEEKSEATLDIAEPAPGLDGCPGCPLCCCGWCWCCICGRCCCLLISSSIKVATFGTGTGGGGEVGIPNGFFDPVCCATRGFIGPGELIFSGADAGQGGTDTLFTGFCGKGDCGCCCCIRCGSENGESALGCWLGLNELAGLNGCCCSEAWPKTGNGLVPWLVGEGPNGEGFFGGGPKRISSSSTSIRNTVMFI